MVSHSSTYDQVSVGTVSKAIFAKTLIDSQHLISPGQSVEHYEWRFMPMSMTVVQVLPHNPFFISPSTMPSSTKVLSTLYSSKKSDVKSVGISKAVMQTMKKKEKQIMELSDEEE